MTDIRVDERGRLLVDDVQIKWHNFSGKATDKNKEGDRNFDIIIPDEFVDGLLNEGWNVKEKINQKGEIFHTLKVQVKYFDEKGAGCKAVMRTPDGNTEILNPRTIGKLDRADIIKCDLDIRPRYWTYGKTSGKSAQADYIVVDIRENRFDHYFRGYDPNDHFEDEEF